MKVRKFQKFNQKYNINEILFVLVLVRSCEVEGKIYREFEDFVLGIDGCSKCVCVNSVANCDVTKCQEIATDKVEANSIETKQSEPELDDFANIKNQIVKQYFSDYDAARLKIITDALGCKSSDCPQLLAASKIEYNILDVYGKKFIGREDRINKIVIQSTDTEVVNSSPAQQTITTISYFLKCIQSLEVKITKTTTTRSEKKINLFLYKKKTEVTFTQKEEETYRERNETTIFFPSQNVTTDAFTKMNVTFNFFQFDDINKYFVDFEIALNSTISHPEVDDTSNVIFVKKSLGDFLQKHTDFLSTLKYPNDTVIQLEAIEKPEKKFVLKNFPTFEMITGYGVDVLFGHASKA